MSGPVHCMAVSRAQVWTRVVRAGSLSLVAHGQANWDLNILRRQPEMKYSSSSPRRPRPRPAQKNGVRGPARISQLPEVVKKMRDAPNPCFGSGENLTHLKTLPRSDGQCRREQRDRMGGSSGWEAGLCEHPSAAICEKVCSLAAFRSGLIAEAAVPGGSLQGRGSAEVASTEEEDSARASPSAEPPASWVENRDSQKTCSSPPPPPPSGARRIRIGRKLLCPVERFVRRRDGAASPGRRPASARVTGGGGLGPAAAAPTSPATASGGWTLRRQTRPVRAPRPR